MKVARALPGGDRAVNVGDSSPRSTVLIPTSSGNIPRIWGHIEPLTSKYQFTVCRNESAGEIGHYALCKAQSWGSWKAFGRARLFTNKADWWTGRSAAVRTLEIRNVLVVWPLDPALPHTDFPEKEIKRTCSLLCPFYCIDCIQLHRPGALMVNMAIQLDAILMSCHDLRVQFLLYVLFLCGSNLCFHCFSMCFCFLLVFYFALCSSFIFTWH